MLHKVLISGLLRKQNKINLGKVGLNNSTEHVALLNDFQNH